MPERISDAAVRRDMPWRRVGRSDPAARAIADRHYNRQSIGAREFVPPGRCLVLLATTRRWHSALWITSWPFPEFVKHRWAGAWQCSAFRNEGAGLSSELITAAVAATRSYMGEPPALGLVTFVDPDKVKPKDDPGYCFLKAAFERCGETKGGLLAFRLAPERMPAAARAAGLLL
jgi:hypothetical protein